MSFPTPSDSTPAVRHERGVFEDEHTFSGLRVFRLYACHGGVVEVALVDGSWYDDGIKTELIASLDRRCPPGEAHSHDDDSPPRPRRPFSVI